MARYTGPSCRLCRREGTKLYLKGERCLTGKCAVARRAGAPGQHGAQNKKLKEYGMQLREKQKAKRIYGVQEKQFKNLFAKADRKEGQTGENLLICWSVVWTTPCSVWEWRRTVLMRASSYCMATLP